MSKEKQMKHALEFGCDHLEIVVSSHSSFSNPGNVFLLVNVVVYY